MTNMFEVFIIISIYIYYLRPVTGSLPAAPQWAGTGPESVRCWERRTGSCPVLALCGISKVYYHVLSPICFMSFTWITLREIWVQNDRNRYELLMIMSMFIYNLKPVTDSLPAVLWWAGTGLELVWSWEHRTGSCPVPAFCGISMGHYHVLRFWIYPTVLQGQYMSICSFKCLSPIL